MTSQYSAHINFDDNLSVPSVVGYNSYSEHDFFAVFLLYFVSIRLFHAILDHAIMRLGLINFEETMVWISGMMAAHDDCVRLGVDFALQEEELDWELTWADLLVATSHQEARDIMSKVSGDLGFGCLYNHFTV